MTGFSNSISRWRRAPLRAACLAILCAALIAAAAARTDEPPTDIVGAIDGESISVTGPMSAEVVHGQVKTVLRSGSDVRVKSGTARIDLIEGGQISICGPAHYPSSSPEVRSRSLSILERFTCTSSSSSP